MDLGLKLDTSYCVTNNRAVFLDLSTDRYVCLPPDLEGAFLNLLQDPPGTKTDESAQSLLIDTGLFIRNPDTRPFVAPAAIPTPKRSLLEQDEPTCLAMHVAVATVSQLITTLRLRNQSLGRTVIRLRRQKANGHAFPHDVSDAEISRYVRAFLMTRRLIANQNRCLQRSIALVDYLALFGLYPTFVIGVRMQPFAAHAWVQFGETVLNDYLDEVLVHTPILVV